jgi:Zn-finger nucleic acid-binding protein
MHVSKCPKCHHDMELASYDRIQVDRCTHCKGLWFDSGELEELRKDTWMADYILDEGDRKVGKQFNRISAIHCPVCNKDMREEFDAEQPHILYETCPDGHGSFLDAGEFTDLVNKTFWDRFKSSSRR